MYNAKFLMKFNLIFILFYQENFAAETADGGLYGMILDTALNCKYDENWCDTECTIDDNIYITWYETSTNASKTFPLCTASKDLIEAGFNCTKKLIVYFEGYVNDKTKANTKEMATALTSTRGNNILIPDYRKYVTQTSKLPGPYEDAVANSYEVVACLAKFFINLLEHQNIADITLLGHSLGGQIVGMVGYKLKKLGKTIPNCIGMDSAGPCFDKMEHDDIRLTKGDCGYTQAIHSNRGQLGTSKLDCDMDVLINCGGRQQPYCYSEKFCYLPPLVESLGYNLAAVSTCSHMYAPQMYKETILDSGLYEGVLCDGSSKDKILVGHNAVAGAYSGVVCVDTYKECGDCPKGKFHYEKS